MANDTEKQLTDFIGALLRTTLETCNPPCGLIFVGFVKDPETSEIVVTLATNATQELATSVLRSIQGKAPVAAGIVGGHKA